MAKWGDGESGRRRRGGSRDLGEKWWPGGGKPLVKSNIVVARYYKRAIAKLAIASFTKRATAIPSSFFPFFVYFFLHFIFFLSPFSISFIFIYFSICFSFYFLFVSSSALHINALL